MKATSVLLITLLPASLLTSCLTTGVKGNYLEVQGKQMRMRNSIEAKMLYAGTKDRAGIDRFSSHLPCVVPSGLKAEVLTTADIESVKGLTVALSAEGIPGVNQPGIDIESGSTTKSSFVILGNPNEDAIIQALNAPENKKALDFLREQSPEARVITEIATTLGHQSGRTAKVSIGAAVDMKALQLGTGSLKLKTTSNKETKVKFSDNTVFAYTMSIPAWKKDSSGKLIVGDLVPDQRSKLFRRLPKPLRGTYLNPSEVP